jgi:hypothetical protein
MLNAARSSGQLERLVRQHYKYFINQTDLTIKIITPNAKEIKKVY